MEAYDISRIAYELIRTRDDRQLMKWEDDRGQLLKEIDRLNAEHKRDQAIIKSVKKQWGELKSSLLKKTKTVDKSPPSIKSSSGRSILHSENPSLKDSATLSNTKPEPSATNLPEETHKKRKRVDPVAFSLSDTEGINRKKPLTTDTSTTSTSSNTNITNSSNDNTSTKSSTISNSKPKSKEPYATVTAQMCSKEPSSSHKAKFNSSNRKQSVRDALPGHACIQCQQYYDTLLQQGIVVILISNNFGYLHNCFPL